MKINDLKARRVPKGEGKKASMRGRTIRQYYASQKDHQVDQFVIIHSKSIRSTREISIVKEREFCVPHFLPSCLPHPLHRSQAADDSHCDPCFLNFAGF